LSIEDRISITDFVNTKPFPIGEAKTKVAELLRKLHSLSPFPRLVNYQDSINGFIQKFQAAKILPESLTDEIFRQYSRIAAVYPNNDEDLVACHNDLKPENILFDGERTWLVDWESAFLNDRYADLVVVSNFLVKNDEDEDDFLRSYFGEAADEYKHARFYLAKQRAHIFYLVVFMLIASKGKPVDPNMEKPDFREFHNRIWAGEISLAGDEAKLQYARVHMEQFLNNMNTKRFEDALSIVSNYHK
jgi:thiamine kinase-like enzyme